MNRFIPVAIIVVFFAFLFYTLMMTSSSVLYSNSGLMEQLDEQAQEDLTGKHLSDWDAHYANDENVWGVTWVVIFAVLIVLLIIYAFNASRRYRGNE